MMSTDEGADRAAQGAFPPYESINGCVICEKDGLLSLTPNRDNTWARTKEVYSPPARIRLRARTNWRNIRLKYAEGFVIFNWAQSRMSLDEARTLAFCTMVTFEWFRAFNARSDELTVFKLGVFRNKLLVAAIGVAILLQMAVVYVPFLQTAFRTVPLGIDRWGIAIAAGGSLFVIEELRKVLFPRLFSLGKWHTSV